MRIVGTGRVGDADSESERLDRLCVKNEESLEDFFTGNWRWV